MQNYKKIPTEYDVAIIGSDLSGLILAQLLCSEHDLKTVVISSKQSLEDFRADSVETQQSLNEDFNYFPNTEESTQLLKWLETNIIGESLQEETGNDLKPITFDSGQFKEFLGFGSRKLKTIDALDYYLTHSQTSLKLSPQEWLKLILKNFKAEFFPKAYVTGVEIENDNVSALILNDAQALVAKKIIYTDSPKEILQLIPNEYLISKAKQKIAKTEFWARVNLSFTYKQSFEFKPEMHILMGSSDEFEPVVGQFQLSPTQEEGARPQIKSHWTYLINNEDYDSDEALGTAIKYMKRQIKRAYPDSFDLVVSEKISVFRDTHGQVLLDGGISKKLTNFYVASPHFSPLKGLLGSLQKAKEVYDGFFSPTV